MRTERTKRHEWLTLLFIAPAILVPLTSCITKHKTETIAPIKEQKFVPEHSPNVFLITYDEKVGKEPILKAVKEYRCKIKYDYNGINCMALTKPEDKSLEETMQFFRSVEGVKTVEYDHIIRLTDPVKPRFEVK